MAKGTKLRCLTFSRIYGFIAFGALVPETSNLRRGQVGNAAEAYLATVEHYLLLRQLSIMIDIHSRIFLHPRANAREPKYGSEDYFELKATIAAW